MENYVNSFLLIEGGLWLENNPVNRLIIPVLLVVFSTNSGPQTVNVLILQ